MGDEARGCLFVAALRGRGAPWRPWSAAYGQRHSVYRREAAGTDGRAGGPAVRWDSTVGRAPPEKIGGVRSGPQPGRLRRPDPHLGGSTGRPLRLRVTGLRPNRSLDGHAAVLPERGSGQGRRRLPRRAGAAGRRGRHGGPEPAHEPPPRDPERYPARHAGERGLGGLKGWRCVATRYGQ